jgi:peptidoglycan/LPS O-acetylase OafA/YrhL
MIVVSFHLCEAKCTGPYDQLINHGYLAVDFFFVLSGFVVGYAYDDWWGELTIDGFFKHRLERLQPMVVMGMLIGAACFYFGDSQILE